MSQSTLTAFGPDHFREPTKKVAAFDCHNCHNQRGFRGSQVHCLGRLKDIPAKGCSSWSDGKELEYMVSFVPPDDFVPRKWRGEA